MLVKDIMGPKPPVIEYDRTTAEAAQAMVNAGAGCLVVSKQGEIIGLVTGRDLAVGCLVEGHRFWECRVFRHMSFPVLTTESSADVFDVMETMDSKHVNRLPVVDDGALVGVVTVTDIIRAFDRSVTPSVAGVTA